MNSYQFKIEWQSTGDARNNAEAFKQLLISKNCPNAAKSVSVKGTHFEFVIAGNMSACSIVAHLEERSPASRKKYGGEYTVTPVGSSSPLPRIHMIG